METAPPWGAFSMTDKDEQLAHNLLQTINAMTVWDEQVVRNVVKLIHHARREGELSMRERAAAEVRIQRVQSVRHGNELEAVEERIRTLKGTDE